jgi:hypothetical protein
MLLATPTPPTSTATWVLIGLSVALIIYVTVRPFMRRKDPLAHQPLRLNLARQKSIEREMENLLVELHEMARTMNAQLETRVVRLETLLRDADERALRLERLLEQQGSDRMPERPALTITPLDPEPSRREDDRWDEIRQLASRGLTERQIAAEVGRPLGEVEFVLNLLRQRPTASAKTSANDQAASDAA